MLSEQHETDITGRTGREAPLAGFNEDCAAIRVRVLYSSRIPRRNEAGDFLCDTACSVTSKPSNSLFTFVIMLCAVITLVVSLMKRKKVTLLSC